MRAWFSVPIIKGVRTGISVNMNPAARFCRVSPIGAKRWLAIWFVAPACGISTNERCLRRVQSTRAISHAQSLEPNRVINRDRCRDGRLVLALVQGSGTSTRILTAPHLSKVNPLSFARECIPLPSRQKTGSSAGCRHAEGKKNCART
jgi:hypothetical protein